MNDIELMTKLPAVLVMTPGGSYVWNLQPKRYSWDMLYVPQGGYTRAGIKLALDIARNSRLPIAYNSRQLELAINKYLKAEDFEVRVNV